MRKEVVPPPPDKEQRQQTDRKDSGNIPRGTGIGEWVEQRSQSNRSANA